MGQKVSHICVIDGKSNIYLEKNHKLGGLTFIGGKLHKGETHENGAIRELSEETSGFLSLPTGVLEEINHNSETINGVLWQGALYGIRISAIHGTALILNQKNIVKVNFKNILLANISEQINKDNLIKNTQLTINKILKNERQ